MQSLFGAAEPIAITKRQYEELIRDSERVNVLKRIMKKDDYIRMDELKAVLGIEDDKQVPNF